MKSKLDKWVIPEESTRIYIFRFYLSIVTCFQAFYVLLALSWPYLFTDTIKALNLVIEVSWLI